MHLFSGKQPLFQSGGISDAEVPATLLTHEFTVVFIVTVYVPPSANASAVNHKSIPQHFFVY